VFQKAVRMKLILFGFSFALFFSAGVTLASPEVDSVNGNLIPEPRLLDYSHAERTPGFSTITVVEIQNDSASR